MNKKYFTIEEANEILVKAKPILERLVNVTQGIRSVEGVSVTFNDHFMAYSHAIIVSEQYHKCAHELYLLLLRLLKLGIIVKDSSTGLIDFYARCNGRDVFLCYRLGEENVHMWHEANAGYQGRKPISLMANEPR